MTKTVVMTLQNPLDESDLLEIEYEVLDTTIGNQWFDHCIMNLNKRQRVEKNFCWLGWPDQNRTVEFLAERLERCVDTINEFADTNNPHWNGYRIEKSWEDITSDDALNQLHHHFEILMGQVWDVAIYMRSADPKTSYAIRQLNNLVHELQARKYANKSGMTVVSYLDPIREEFDEQHYDSFSINRNFGDIFLHYAQTGKTPIEAFEDNDDYVFNNNINALRYMSGEFNIWWNASTSESDVNSTKEKLGAWLNAREVIMQEQDDFCYYVDPDGNKQGIGWLTVAKIKNPFETEDELVEEVNKRLNIYKLACYIDGEFVTEMQWDYKWSDEDYIENEVEYLTPLFPCSQPNALD